MYAPDPLETVRSLVNTWDIDADQDLLSTPAKLADWATPGCPDHTLDSAAAAWTGSAPHGRVYEIAWLVRDNRGVRYRGVTKKDHWLHHHAAAVNLRRLITLGLHHDGTTWVII